MNKLKITAPEPSPESGWTPLVKFPNFGEGKSFLNGDTENNRVRVAYFSRQADNMLCAKAWFGWAAEGPPGHAHGGSILTVFDEAMGMSTWLAGHLTVAASVTANFRKKLPLGTYVTVEAWVRSIERRKVFTQAKLYHPQKKYLFAEAQGLFVMQDIEQFGEKEALLNAFQGHQ